MKIRERLLQTGLMKEFFKTSKSSSPTFPVTSVWELGNARASRQCVCVCENKEWTSTTQVSSSSPLSLYPFCWDRHHENKRRETTTDWNACITASNKEQTTEQVTKEVKLVQTSVLLFIPQYFLVQCTRITLQSTATFFHWLSKNIYNINHAIRISCMRVHSLASVLINSSRYLITIHTGRKT